VVLQLGATTREEAIRELAAFIERSKLPPGVDVAQLALAREAEVSTDLGVGVAVPHARCPGLAAPLVVLGRSPEGVRFSHAAAESVRLLFLLVTPADEPDLQLALLAQVARVASDRRARERIARAATATEILDVLADRASGLRGSRGEFEAQPRS
jgi:mannitol/fructose-specific phosphotransferase system IIA component (Ntr-type)